MADFSAPGQTLGWVLPGLRAGVRATGSYFFFAGSLDLPESPDEEPPELSEDFAVSFFSEEAPLVCFELSDAEPFLLSVT